MQVWPVCRRQGRRQVWLSCPCLSCSLAKVPAGCPGVLKPKWPIRGVLLLAEMGLHPCGHNVQPSAGTAQGKPMDMTTEGSHGASGPLWTRLCPGHYSVPDPLGLHSNRGLWRGFWSLSSSVNSDPMSKCPQNVPFPQCAVCSQWRKLLSQEILKSPRLCQSVTGKKKKRICLSFSFYKATNLFWLGFHPFPHLRMITS